ncbi:relaxase/mobilization nuclease domain-containing protein [Streptomyces acidiscabies]|uniref:Relaxase/mobilization nuclease domain-containing protein n=1 Tax=Streptomyces acidiscabies TaxID=42234 RepID=A0AAP6BKT3_9ACTN|nr:relaxase/mobilization nuclease domain-containing protein [Streptomyces acidiscabies]MBP5937911.1 relaxase/mobilization nuclease domain-containing protein [Streptomyces sp. LBUM 1476]MBZ3908911.1 relaxase/mobilization nuclease domain-containing protein [Streptomyces acidiscabies]MDX2966583.1 relaxase/mobilization nuclease domain-containing protein [Streptomyces acidiscabies]MDX3016682.1 relaxase/mobilization nuclease domain-containing protein [Streptomyces acidiscabies]MDX3788410.1 relaxase/
MIANIVKPGSNTRGVLIYLFGPGRATAHTDQHIVASWDGFAPDPGPEDSRGHRERMNQLVKALDLRVEQASDRVPKGHLWHCSLRAAPEDRTLTDAEWSTIARRVLHATGIAPDGDPDGCRWIAVRHADDHIHIVATKMRGDLRPPRNWNDYHRAMTELTRIETDFGLHQVNRDRDTWPAAKRPTRAETEKATRNGRDRAVREQLRLTVRTALSHAHTVEEFLNLLADAGLQVETRTLPSGDLQGYKVALPDDIGSGLEPVWYSGSSLATDLSLPQIQQRLAAVKPSRIEHRPNPWHQATAGIERIPHHLAQNDPATASAHLVAFGEVLYALPAFAPAHLRAELRKAAIAFEYAVNTRARVDHHHAGALRGALKTMRHHPADDNLVAMLVDAAILAVIAVRRRNALEHHNQRVAAAQQTLHHLQAAYGRAASTPLSQLAERRPPVDVRHRYAEHLRKAVPAHAEQILAEAGWDALTAVLVDAERAGHNPASLLRQAAGQRPLDDARSPAEVLTWRVQRLGARHVPSARARTAQARSTAASARSVSRTAKQIAPAITPPTSRPHRPW